MLYTTKPENFNPKIIVVSAFLENKGKILLLKRQDSKPEGNTWGMPAGKVDNTESIYDGVIREIKEETGVDVKRDNIEYFRKFFVRYPEYDFIYHIFSAKLVNKPKVIINRDEHKKFKWVKPKESLKMDLIEDLGSCIEAFYFSK